MKLVPLACEDGQTLFRYPHSIEVHACLKKVFTHMRRVPEPHKLAHRTKKHWVIESAHINVRKKFISYPAHAYSFIQYTSKTCLKRPLKKKTKVRFQDQLSLNAGQTYCRMLQGEHSAILSTFIKLPFANKIFVLSIFEWPLKTGFTQV